MSDTFLAGISLATEQTAKAVDRVAYITDESQRVLMGQLAETNRLLAAILVELQRRPPR